jgi:hypothetical protein
MECKKYLWSACNKEDKTGSSNNDDDGDYNDDNDDDDVILLKSLGWSIDFLFGNCDLAQFFRLSLF